MELHQLRYFLAVVDEGSFTAAADAVRISQSGISTQIQKLERELGIVLIDRSARRVALTDAGATLVPYARNALAAAAGVNDAAQAVRGLVVGSLRVATVTGLVWPRLFDALAAVHTDHPGIDLRLEEGVSADHLTAVREGTVDVAVAAWAGEDPVGVEVSVVVDDPLVVVVARDHPWSTRARIRPDELVSEDLVTLPRGTGSRAALDALLVERSGRGVAPRWEVATPNYVVQLVRRGLGIGVVSATTARDWDEIVAIPIDHPSASSRLGVVWRRSPSHATRALLRLLV